MRAANKYIIALFSGLFFMLIASVPAAAQTFGGGTTSNLYGASNASYFQAPGAITQSGSSDQAAGGATILQNVTTTGLVVVGASVPTETTQDYIMDSDTTELVLFSAVAALIGLGSLLVLWRMIKHSY